MNTTLNAEKVADYTLMLCDALYMDLKNQQIRLHQRSLSHEINMDYHRKRIEEITNHGPDAEFFFRTGKRYYKLIMRDSGGQKSVHAFIDRETGDVYKPASWKGPVKDARYCIANEYDREWLYQNADWAGKYLYLK